MPFFEKNLAVSTHEVLIQGIGFDWAVLTKALTEVKHLETLR
jgi:hypothetical protein